MRTRTQLVGGISLAVALIAAVTLPANASTEAEASSDDAVVVTSPMEVIGYDEAVAAENGFKIVTYPDGSWESVALTPEAKLIEAATGGPERVAPERAPGMSARKVTIYGNCGSSFIAAQKSGSAQRVTTGYTVDAPVANRTNWVVQVTSLGGLPSISWPTGPSGVSWSGTGTFSTGGFGGQAFVTPSSSVVTIKGRVCSSGSPAEGY